MLCMTCYESHAQMGTAATINWDVDVRFDVPIQQDSVWTLLKNYTLISKLSNGYVLRIVDKGQILPIAREVSLSNGTQRAEMLTQQDEQHKFLVYSIDKRSLQEGLSLVQVAVFTKEKDGHTEINWKAIIQGKDEAKKQEAERMKIEAEHYRKGWQQYLQSQN